MKRRHFITAFALLPPLLQACLSEPIPPTIFTGIIIDESDKPIKDIDLYFGGNTGGFNPKSTFELRTKTDEKGYYYLEKIIPPQTVDITFKPEGNSIYTNGLYDFLCLVNGVYQFEIPIITQTKNEFNFKIVKRK
ncbi:MAG: hypothetical protein U5N85_18935 [Arcicella sp.]|nr:hypothetical protein [Arcicella sp.]